MAVNQIRSVYDRYEIIMCSPSMSTTSMKIEIAIIGRTTTIDHGQSQRQEAEEEFSGAHYCMEW